VDEINRDGIVDIVNAMLHSIANVHGLGLVKVRVLSVWPALLYLPHGQHISVNEILRQSYSNCMDW